MASKVTAEVMSLNKEKVESREIGEIVLREIRKLDEIAYIRYMVYFNRDFHNSAELKDILDQGPQVKRERKQRSRSSDVKA